MSGLLQVLELPNRAHHALGRMGIFAKEQMS
jgi:hypothetical protein